MFIINPEDANYSDGILVKDVVSFVKNIRRVMDNCGKLIINNLTIYK